MQKVKVDRISPYKDKQYLLEKLGSAVEYICKDGEVWECCITDSFSLFYFSRDIWYTHWRVHIDDVKFINYECKLS